MTVASPGPPRGEGEYSPKSISVIVPTYRRPDALAETLDALVALEYPPDRYEVVVVDDGPDDSAADVVQAAGNTRRIVYLTQANSGVARARNHGAERAAGDLLVFLDDDLLVEPDHLSRHLEDQARFGDALVNGHWEFSAETLAQLQQTPFGRFRIQVERWVKDGVPKETLSERHLRPSLVTACNLGVRAETFRRLGGFDEGFPYAGCEDQDLSLRARAAGLEFVYDTEIRLHHNDRRATLQEFGERQRRGAITHVHLAMRHPEVRRTSKMLRDNGPIHRGEPVGRAAKKLAKAALSIPPALAATRAIARALEIVAPRSRMLWRTYWAILGLYIHLGIRHGLRTAEPGKASAPVPEPLPR